MLHNEKHVYVQQHTLWCCPRSWFADRRECVFASGFLRDLWPQGWRLREAEVLKKTRTVLQILIFKATKLILFSCVIEWYSMCGMYYLQPVCQKEHLCGWNPDMPADPKSSLCSHQHRSAAKSSAKTNTQRNSMINFVRRFKEQRIWRSGWLFNSGLTGSRCESSHKLPLLSLEEATLM